jgi:nicotinate dehydrogenase subunit B
MAPVVQQLAALPDEDIRAMASYLASFNPADAGDAAQGAAQIVAQARDASAGLAGAGQRLFNGACSACHHDGDGPTLLGVNRPLALSSKLHSEGPDNLIRIVLDGIREPASRDIGFMPAFRHSLNERQIVELVAYMRRRFAPGKPAWPRLDATVTRLRGSAGPP